MTSAPLATFIDTLDHHQGAATAILTAALVAVTIYYAIQNRAMVKEMKHARDAALLPKLALDFHRLGPTAMTLAIRNVGPGAAIDVDVRAVWDPVADGAAPEQPWRRNILAPGEQADFMPPGETINDNINTLPATYRRVRLLGTMKDAAGNRHKVEECFDDLAEWREVLRAARQRYVTADPERRLADELDKKLSQQLQQLAAGANRIAAAVERLQPGDRDQAAEPGNGG